MMGGSSLEEDSQQVKDAIPELIEERNKEEEERVVLYVIFGNNILLS